MSGHNEEFKKPRIDASEEAKLEQLNEENKKETEAEKKKSVGIASVLIVVSAWLFFFAFGVWMPSRCFLESAIYDRPIEWVDDVNGEMIFDVFTKGGDDFVNKLVRRPQYKNEAPEEHTAGDRGFVRVSFESPPGKTPETKEKPVQIAQFHVPHSDAIVDSLLDSIYPETRNENSPQNDAGPQRLNAAAKPVPENSAADSGNATAQNPAAASIPPSVIPGQTKTGSKDDAKAIRIIYNRIPKEETAEAQLGFFKRIWYVFLGLLSGSMVNLAILCVLASVAGEYTRIILYPDEEAPDKPGACFRGFIVFLFFISGELLFLGNVTGGPTPDDNLHQLTQSAFVRTAGFASVICLACSYRPKIIGTFLTRVAGLLESGSVAESNELQSSPAGLPDSDGDKPTSGTA